VLPPWYPASTGLVNMNIFALAASESTSLGDGNLIADAVTAVSRTAALASMVRFVGWTSKEWVGMQW
jgi:hypothetical protein